MGEREAKAVLSAYGLSVPREMLVRNPEEAARAADEIGGNLVLKVDSPDILHKTDAGGVVLDVSGADAAKRAYEGIMDRCRRSVPGARIDGVLVQEMVPAGVEVLVGFRNLPGFGPALTVGMGGVMTELLRDAVTVLAPVSEEEATALCRRLKGARLFDGYRGAPPVSMPELAKTVSAISRLASDFPDRIAEFDVNPVLCLPDRAVAVDGIAVLKTVGETDGL